MAGEPKKNFSALAYLDVEHPVVAWGVYRGVLVSATAGPPPDGGAQPVSMMFARMLEQRNIMRLNNELLIESVRAHRHSHQVSRLEGMFFFERNTEAYAAEATTITKTNDSLRALCDLLDLCAAAVGPCQSLIVRSAA